MGSLGVKHGFYGEDPGIGGAGESLSITDRQETWIFHILGGLRNASATWAAQRVPDDHVAVVANNFIIQKLNCSDKENFMCSENVFSNARALNLCDFETEADFNFMRCYVPDPRTFLDGPGPALSACGPFRIWPIQKSHHI
jgi:dipeptidase